MECPICKATKNKQGKEFTTQGQINLHLRTAHGVRKEPDRCEHSFRFLTAAEAARVDAEGKALGSYGFKSVCTKCGELQ